MKKVMFQAGFGLQICTLQLHQTVVGLAHGKQGNPEEVCWDNLGIRGEPVDGHSRGSAGLKAMRDDSLVGCSPLY